MEPSEEWLKKLLSMMSATQVLARSEAGRLSPLRCGLIIALFENPLLRTVVIDGKSYIAHVTPGIEGITVMNNDNPLENKSSEGDHRVRIYGGSNEIAIERNMGPRYKDHIERSIDAACTRAGNEMMRTEDYTGRAGQQFSTLVHATIHSFGTAFEWKKVNVLKLSRFKSMDIVERHVDPWYATPTFDLVLSS